MIALAATVLALLPAHPLGNFSINQLVELELQRDKVSAVAILDLAELPTLQNKMEAAPACAAFARDVEVTVHAKPVTWQLSKASMEYQQGAAGLKTSRITCHLVAPAALDSAADLTVVNRHLPDRAGWRELTATGLGVTGLPARSVTDGLRSYPDDKLSSPLDVREAHLRLNGTSSPELSSTVTAAPSLLARAETWLQNNISSTELTPWIGFLAILLATVLGAAHAALPGHGKTVMAVYLAGRAGRPRDALAVGATVTATHTGGVLLLGLLLSSTTWLAGETALGWLGLASGAIIVLVGLSMLRHRTHSHHHHHSHDHHHPHPTHGHEGAPHTHEHGRTGKRALAALGIAGGLVPSPSALIVLLGAIALGRTGFGVVLVLAYGLGMAGTLTLAGLTLLTLRDRFDWLAKLLIRAPGATAALVLIVGAALATRSALTL